MIGQPYRMIRLAVYFLISVTESGEASFGPLALTDAGHSRSFQVFEYVHGRLERKA